MLSGQADPARPTPSARRARGEIGSDSIAPGSVRSSALSFSSARSPTTRTPDAVIVSIVSVVSAAGDEVALLHAPYLVGETSPVRGLHDPGDAPGFGLELDRSLLLQRPFNREIWPSLADGGSVSRARIALVGAGWFGRPACAGGEADGADGTRRLGTGRPGCGGQPGPDGGRDVPLHVGGAAGS